MACKSSSSPSFHYTRRDALRTVALTIGATALPGAFGFLSTAMPAASPAASPEASAAPVTSTSLGGMLTLVSGLGGNIVVLGGNDGGLMIDSGIPDAAAKTQSEVGKDGAIALLVNTHWHYDHVGGNELIAKAGARVIATENCRKRMSAEQNMEALELKIPACAEGAWPRVSFNHETALHVNGDDIRLVPVAAAHTDGDLFVHFQKADLIHTGDLFFHGMYPFIDWSSGGWIGGVIAAVRTVLASTTEKTRIVPGHGPLATQADLKSYLAFLETMLERFEKMKAAGKSADEVLAAAPTKDFDAKLGQGFLTPEKFVRIAYTGLLKHG